MKKNILAILLLFISVKTFAENYEVEILPAYNRIKIFDLNFPVHLLKKNVSEGKSSVIVDLSPLFPKEKIEKELNEEITSWRVHDLKNTKYNNQKTGFYENSCFVEAKYQSIEIKMKHSSRILFSREDYLKGAKECVEFVFRKFSFGGKLELPIEVEIRENYKSDDEVEVYRRGESTNSHTIILN